jgi:hypothetical protein
VYGCLVVVSAGGSFSGVASASWKEAKVRYFGERGFGGPLAGLQPAEKTQQSNHHHYRSENHPLSL